MHNFPVIMSCDRNEFQLPRQWRWVTRFEPAGVPVIRHPRHARWMRKNTHNHSTREIMVVLEGRDFYGVRDRICRADRGTVFLFDKHEPHDNGYPKWHSACRHMWIHLYSPRLLAARDTIFANGQFAVFVTMPPERASRLGLWHFDPLRGVLVECLTECWDLCAQHPDRSSIEALKAAVIMVLHYLWRNCRFPALPQGQHRRQQNVIDSIQEYIGHHLDGKISLEVMAGIAGYEPHYFHRLFCKYAGETPQDYLNRLRLKQACNLLARGQMVQVVAEALGFGSAAYFSRFFRNTMGVPPAVWCEQSRRHAG